ncbi:MAG: DUF3500 domain-containing protein [Anaerolineae bacterium]|nr:DUF3500 domain-containing protein [Candidatus Roseilinea sp.]MDW8449152.1 DUF3500 domain-containing protein [Anaerolineae bacterium]
MSNRISRRKVIKLAALGGAGSWLAAACAAAPQTTQPAQPPQAPTSLPAPARPAVDPSPAAGAANQVPPTPAAPPSLTEAVQADATGTLTHKMADAATRFLATLDDAQRAKATYAFDDAERLRWHWTTPRNFPRNGLSLQEMNREQKDAALALLQSSLSALGFQKSLDIMSLQNDLGNDPEAYFVTVFGAPGSNGVWAWRWEGHHLSRHFTIRGDRVAVTPFFHGAWPTVSNTGLRAMPREEDAARELIRSLVAIGKTEAIFQERSLTRHVTWNSERVGPLEPVGVLVGDFTTDQQALVHEIIHAYLDVLPEPIASDHLTRLQNAGFEQMRFGWAGALEPRRPHYYRLQGPTFLLEFDNSRNGATHIHSVWRDFVQDFGYHLI